MVAVPHAILSRARITTRGVAGDFVSAARRGTVTLIYSSHDEQYNNAVALKDYVRAKMRTPHASPDAVEANRPRAAR